MLLCPSGRTSLGQFLTGAGALQAEIGTITAYACTSLLHPKQGICLAWGSRSRMQRDCIAVQYSRSGLLHYDPFFVSQLSCGPLSYFGFMETNLVNRHAKRSCTQSSRFRIRRGELNSHAFSLVNRLQHQILRAICSNRRRFPLAQSPNPHAQVGPHGTGSSAVSVLMLARVSVLNPFTMTRATVAMTVNIKMLILETPAATPHVEQNCPVSGYLQDVPLA